LRIDEHFIENEVKKRLNLEREEQSKKKSLFFCGTLFFLLALFFILLFFEFDQLGIRRIGFLVGSGIFFGLFLPMAISFIKIKNN